MKIIDEKGKLFGLINIIDLCALLLVLVLIAGVLIKTGSIGGNNTSGSNVENKMYLVTVKCYGINEESLENIAVGDEIVYADTPPTGVVIKDIRVEDSVMSEMRLTDQSTVVSYKDPTIRDVTFDLLVPSPANVPYVQIGKYGYGAGSDIFVRTNKFIFKGRVILVKEQ